MVTIVTQLRGSRELLANLTMREVRGKYKRTALGQIVAEELDVSFARVVVVLGDTSLVPNQGATIASETIQITAVPLRKAAAQARQFLVARAAERLIRRSSTSEGGSDEAIRFSVVPGRCKASNPESRDSGSGADAPSGNDG